MTPFLRRLGDGRERPTAEVASELADEFGLSPEERVALLPSGKQAVFANRVGWATTYLSKAGLVERTGRRRVRITQGGLEALRDVEAHGGRVDARYLRRYPAFLEFEQGSSPGERDKESGTVAKVDPAPPPDGLPPDEALAASYGALRAALAQDLLDHVGRSSPASFERLVIDLLVAMGYGGSHEDAARAVGGSGDDGVDGIIKEDRLGPTRRAPVC